MFKLFSTEYQQGRRLFKSAKKDLSLGKAESAAKWLLNAMALFRTADATPQLLDAVELLLGMEVAKENSLVAAIAYEQTGEWEKAAKSFETFSESSRLAFETSSDTYLAALFKWPSAKDIATEVQTLSLVAAEENYQRAHLPIAALKCRVKHRPLNRDDLVTLVAALVDEGAEPSIIAGYYRQLSQMTPNEIVIERESFAPVLSDKEYGGGTDYIRVEAHYEYLRQASEYYAQAGDPRRAVDCLMEGGLHPILSEKFDEYLTYEQRLIVYPNVGRYLDAALCCEVEGNYEEALRHYAKLKDVANMYRCSQQCDRMDLLFEQYYHARMYEAAFDIYCKIPKEQLCRVYLPFIEDVINHAVKFKGVDINDVNLSYLDHWINAWPQRLDSIIDRLHSWGRLEVLVNVYEEGMSCLENKDFKFSFGRSMPKVEEALAAQGKVLNYDVLLKRYANPPAHLGDLLSYYLDKGENDRIVDIFESVVVKTPGWRNNKDTYVLMIVRNALFRAGRKDLFKKYDINEWGPLT